MTFNVENGLKRSAILAPAKLLLLLLLSLLLSWARCIHFVQLPVFLSMLRWFVSAGNARELCPNGWTNLVHFRHNAHHCAWEHCVKWAAQSPLK